MWLFTRDGFYSAVHDDYCSPGELMIRARAKEDIERMLAKLKIDDAEILVIKNADYLVDIGPAADDRVDDAGGSLGGYLREVAQLPIEEREALAARSLKEGYETVGKLKLYDHVGLDIPIPAGFFETYPQLGIAEDSERADALRTAAATGEPLDLSAFVSPSAAEESEEQEHWGRISSASAYSVSIPDSRSVPGSPTYRYLFSSAYREQVRRYYEELVK